MYIYITREREGKRSEIEDKRAEKKAVLLVNI